MTSFLGFGSYISQYIYKYWGVNIVLISFFESTMMIYKKITVDVVIFNTDFCIQQLFFFLDFSAETAKDMIYCTQVTIGCKFEQN